MSQAKKEPLSKPVYDVISHDHTVWLIFPDQQSVANQCKMMQKNHIDYLSTVVDQSGIFSIHGKYVLKLTHQNYAELCALPPQGCWEKDANYTWASFEQAKAADDFRVALFNRDIGAEWGPRQDKEKQIQRVYTANKYKIYYSSEDMKRIPDAEIKRFFGKRNADEQSNWISFGNAQNAELFRQTMFNRGVKACKDPRSLPSEGVNFIYSVVEYRVYYKQTSVDSYKALTDNVEKLQKREAYFEIQFKDVLCNKNTLGNIKSDTAIFCSKILVDTKTPKSFQMKLIEIVNFAAERSQHTCYRSQEARNLLDSIASLTQKVKDVGQDLALSAEDFERKYLPENKEQHVVVQTTEVVDQLLVTQLQQVQLTPQFQQLPHSMQSVHQFQQPMYPTQPVHQFHQPAYSMQTVHPFQQSTSMQSVHQFQQPTYPAQPVNQFQQPAYPTQSVHQFHQSIYATQPMPQYQQTTDYSQLTQQQCQQATRYTQGIQQNFQQAVAPKSPEPTIVPAPGASNINQFGFFSQGQQPNNAPQPTYYPTSTNPPAGY